MHDMGEGYNNKSELYSRVQKLEYKIKELELKLKISTKDMDLYKLIIDLKLDNTRLNGIVQKLIVDINEMESK